MANKYEWGLNPIKDYIVQNLIDDIDISKKKNADEIYSNLVIFFRQILEDENDVNHLDFIIKKSKFGDYNIIANNMVTALWFSGILPSDVNVVLNENKFILSGLEYTFNKKTKKLKLKNIK
jgi:hypothetical protein